MDLAFATSANGAPRCSRMPSGRWRRSTRLLWSSSRPHARSGRFWLNQCEAGSTSRAIVSSSIGFVRPVCGWRFRPTQRAARGQEGPLTGRTYVLTGTLQSMTRDQADGSDRAAWRKGSGVGEQENHRRDCRRRRREQGREGPRAWRDHARRGRVPRTHRALDVAVRSVRL